MPDHQPHLKNGLSRRDALRRKVLLTVALLGVGVTLAGAGTYAAFTSTTTNTSAFSAGTVVLTDNDAGTALFSLSGMAPSDPTTTRCIVVTYSGSLPSTVRLYGTTGGTGLATHLNLKVTRGTIASPSGSSCTGFTADAVNHRSLGAGVLFDSTLAAYPDDYATGLVDATTATPESWTTGEARAYRFDVTLADNDAAQGKDATQVFTWEARNQ